MSVALEPVPQNSSDSLPDKWVGDVRALDPVATTAARIIEDRVHSVARAIKRIARHKDMPDEAVHQLRVSTRRAQAAVLSFEQWMRKSRRRNLTKSLKRLRDAAGAVRMADVHRQLLLAGWTTLNQDLQMADEAALALLGADRSKAQRGLRRTAVRIPSRDLLQMSRTCMRSRATAASTDTSSHALSRDDTFWDAARDTFARLAGEMLRAWNADLTCRENLHQMRLCGKRLRYSIEIFGGAAELSQRADLVALAERLTGLQERLGAINDLHEVAERLVGAASRVEASMVESANEHAPPMRSQLAGALERLADQYESRCNDAADAFRAWWETHDADDLRREIGCLVRIGEREDAPPEIVVLSSAHDPAAHACKSEQSQ